MHDWATNHKMSTCISREKDGFLSWKVATTCLYMLKYGVSHQSTFLDRADQSRGGTIGEDKALPESGLGKHSILYSKENTGEKIESISFCSQINHIIYIQLVCHKL